MKIGISLARVIAFMEKVAVCSVIVMFVLMSCKAKRPEVGTSKDIVNISDEIQTSFYDNVSEYGVLPLESSKESLVANVMKIRVYKDRIYLLSGLENTCLLVFDKTGRFVAKMDRRGRGPTEYLELRNFEIDPVRDEILLLDGMGEKIIVCGLDLDLRREVKIPLRAECAGRLPNGNFVLLHAAWQMSSDDHHVVTVCDDSGRMLNKYMDNDLRQPSAGMSAMEAMTVMNDGTLSVMPQYHNMTYRISDNGIDECFGFAIPGETITIDSFTELHFQDVMGLLGALEGKNYLFGDHAETEKYIFFFNKGGGDLEHIFYNKQSEKHLRARHPLFGTAVFIDDNDYCWASVSEVMLTFSGEDDDELAKSLLNAFDKGENTPLIYYKLRI